MAWVGSTHQTPAPAKDGAVCDVCHQPDKERLSPVLADSDSFGVEYANLCQNCRRKVKEQRAKLPCSRCNNPHPDGLLPMRGEEQEMNYYCPPCHKIIQDAIDRDLKAEEAYHAAHGGFDD